MPIKQDGMNSSRNFSSSIIIDMSLSNQALPLTKKDSNTPKAKRTIESDQNMKGLSSREAAISREHWGPNDVTFRPQKCRTKVLLPTNKAAFLLFIQGVGKTISEYWNDSLIAKYVEQFRNPLIVLLMVSALVSLLLGQIENSLSITLVPLPPSC